MHGSHTNRNIDDLIHAWGTEPQGSMGSQDSDYNMQSELERIQDIGDMFLA